MSQYTPPTFGSFGKSGLFQVYDRDAIEHSVKSVSRAANGTTFESGVVYSETATPRGYVKGTFAVSKAVIDATAHTDAKKAFNVGAKFKNAFPQVKGLNAGVTLTSTEKDFKAAPRFGLFQTYSADYARNNFAATASVVTDAAASHSVSASASVGFDGFAVGGDVKVVQAGEGFKPTSYNAGFAYTKKNYTAAIVSDAKFQKLKATLLAAKVGPNAAFTLGAQAKIDLQAQKEAPLQREVILSVENRVSPSTTARVAAVVTNGTIVSTIEHRLQDPKVVIAATASTAAPNTAFAPFQAAKFGVAVSFGL